MTPQAAIELMKSSNSQKEWNDNFDKVKESCGGYPDFWYKDIIKSGIAAQTIEKWNGTAEIGAKNLTISKTQVSTELKIKKKPLP